MERRRTMPNQSRHEQVTVDGPVNSWLYLHQGSGTDRIAMHWHQSIELSYTIRGEITEFKIENQKFHTKPGDILVVNSQELHQIYSKGQAGDRALSIIFPHQYVMGLYPLIDQQQISINDPSQFSDIQKAAYAQLQGLLLEISKNYLTTSRLKNLRLQCLTDEVLCKLLTYFTVDKIGEYGRSSNYSMERIHLITKYINDNYQSDIRLESLAELCGISKEYLARFFKAQMGQTVGEYINNVREQHARQRLRTSKLNLTMIAIQTGFSGIRTMNRTLEKLYGKSAAELRKEGRKWIT